jgi:molybdate transport system permease protein
MKRHTALIALLSVPALAYLAVPLVGLFAQSAADQVCPLLHCPRVKAALLVTAISSGAAAVVIVLLGTPLAYFLAHGRFRGKRIVDTLVDIPLVLPPAVAGVALFFTFGRMGMIGKHFADHFTIPFTMVAVVMAQVFVSAPLYVRQARVGFLSVPPQLVSASRTLGASHLRTFLKVTLPLASHGLIAGLVLAWARSVGEFGATLVFAGNMQGITQTMSLAIFQEFEARQQLSAVVVMSGILVVISFVVLVVTKAILESAGLREASDAALA